jgi:beta-phosphoglucomutase
MFKAVIFDFDGVICDSEYLHYQALNTIFKRFGVDIPQTVHWERYLGYSDLENIEAVNRDYAMGLDAAAIQEQIAEKKIVFDELARSDAQVIDGVADFIAMLAAGGVPMAICSGALRSDIDLMLSGAAFKEVFAAIVTADDVRHGKPDPEGYRLALARLNAAKGAAMAPEQCVVIEDSHWGLAAAAAAGMKPVAVTNTYSREELDGKACKIVARLDELTVETLNAVCR